MRKTKFEVLAPAGSIESMKAAINAGADAVYMGGVRFGARAYAENPGEDLLLSAIDYAHLHHVRLFMTVNTLLKEKEIEGELINYLKPYAAAGVDAFIIQDMGVWEMVKRAFPQVPLHASTQMTITGAEGAAWAKKHGASRIVTARELSIPEIKKIHEEVDVEIETFVHGAICYCYSGQCLYSSMIGGRSGNRGRCAQPCRLAYDAYAEGKKINPQAERLLMNLKDMCALDVLPDLLDAGVYSLKIEGRMKSPRYTAGVVSIYRKYVDLYEARGRKGYVVDPEDRKLLLELFDRGGQTDGYFKKQNGRDMIATTEKPSFREVDQKLLKSIDEAYILKEKKEKISGKLIIRKQKPVTMELQDGEICVTVTGQVPMEAQSRPLTEEEAKKQFSKFGATMYELEGLEIELDDGLFLPVKAMNELRREAVEKLQEQVLAAYRREIIGCEEISEKKKTEMTTGPYLSALVEEESQFYAALFSETISRIYLSMERVAWERIPELAASCEQKGKEFFLAFPRIFREKGKKELEKHRKYWQIPQVDGFLLRVVDELSMIDVLGPSYRYVADHSLYTMNGEARRVLAEEGFASDTASLELNARELEQRGLSHSEIVAYGRIPMMVSAQCFKQTLKRCDKKPSQLMIQDRKRKQLPVKTYCRFCYNVIYNTDPLYLADEMEALLRLKPEGIRLSFSTESQKETKEVIGAYEEALRTGHTAYVPETFTRGHFRRGVE